MCQRPERPELAVGLGDDAPILLVRDAPDERSVVGRSGVWPPGTGPSAARADPAARTSTIAVVSKARRGDPGSRPRGLIRRAPRTRAGQAGSYAGRASLSPPGPRTCKPSRAIRGNPR